MRKITKSLLTLALLVLAVGSAKARTSIDMSTATASTNATWTSATNTFAWTAENEYVVIPGLSGDLTGCYLDITVSNACRIDIHYTDGTTTTGDWNGYGRFGSGGLKTQDLGLMAGSKINIVDEVRVASTSASGSITITDVSYFYPVIPQFNSSGVATISLKSLTASDGLSYNPSTGVVVCDGTPGRLSLDILNSGIDLTALKRFDVSITGADNSIWRCIVKSQGTDVLAYYGSKWGNNLTSAERARAIAVNDFYWETVEAGALSSLTPEQKTFTINSITLTADVMNCVNAHDVPIETLPHNIVAADGSVSVGAAIATEYGVAADQSLGDGSSKMDEYIDIEDYDELRVYTSDANDRLFFINETIVSGTSGKDGGTLFLTGEGTIFSHNTTEGYYYASIATIKSTYGGQAKLIGVKGPSWGVKSNISKIQVYKENPAYDYILSGQYSAGVDISSVTSDASATAIDCSSLSGNNVTLTSANPNCLFVAKAGVLANSKNVIVSGTCANLELVDGKPFKTPAAFTADKAKFTKTFTDAKCGTMVIPFAADLPSGIEAYNLTGDNGTTITHTDAASIAANAPVLLKSAAATSYEFTATSVAIAATVDESTNGKLIGTYVGTKAAADANNYVLQNGGAGLGFFKVTGTDATVKPFRAYLNTDALASQLALDFGDVTGINAAELVKKVGNETFYNLNGQRVAQPAKGLYIVNGKKIVVK